MGCVVGRTLPPLRLVRPRPWGWGGGYSKLVIENHGGEKRLPENRDALKLSDIVGGGYADYWDFKGRYRVCKGSRASKKSKTTALNFIVRMMQYPEANLLVVRKVYGTLTSSCYTELKWAINRLGVEDYWYCRQNPLEMTYKPTGQKIYFRGLDDPLKVTSITVEHGYLCWMWINSIGSHP